MKKSISSAIAFAATVAALLCLTCGDSGTNSKSPDNNGTVDAFAGKFHRRTEQGTTTTVPNPPANVSGAAVSSNSVTISWPSVSGATGYRVYRSTNSSGSYTQIGTTSATSYTDDELSANTTYYYKVVAYNDAGNSSQSSYASVKTKDDTDNPTLTLPSVPSGVTASTASSSSIIVSWSSVSGATGYYVYRSTSSSGSYTQVGTPTSTSYTNTGLSASTTYYYKVSAYNSAGESSQSSYASATTTSSITIPGTPSGVTASAASSSSIIVSWSSVSGATGYYVYRGTSSAGSYTQLGTSTSTSYTNTGLSASTTYYYKVSAYNSAGEGSQSSSVSATTDAVVIVGGNNCTGAGTCKSKVMPDGKTWMTENLNITTNGSCCYKSSADSCAKYGRLYTWEAAKTACPSGWRLPTSAEWGALVSAAGGSSVAGKKLKSSSGWYNNGNGTDDYGFSALPGGYYTGGSFNDAGSYGLWWTDADEAYTRGMDYNGDNADENLKYRYYYFSVRCVGD